MTEELLEKARRMIRGIKEAEAVVAGCEGVLHAMQDDPESWPRRRVVIGGWCGVPEWKPEDDVYCGIVRQIKASAASRLEALKQEFEDLR